MADQGYRLGCYFWGLKPDGCNTKNTTSEECRSCKGFTPYDQVRTYRPSKELILLDDDDETEQE